MDTRGGAASTLPASWEYGDGCKLSQRRSVHSPYTANAFWTHKCPENASSGRKCRLVPLSRIDSVFGDLDSWGTGLLPPVPPGYAYRIRAVNVPASMQ